jgi:hypothetical protein
MDVKGPKTDFVLDLTNPDLKMMQRDGVNPDLVIFGATPDHSDLVGNAMKRISDVLSEHLTEDNLLLILKSRIELDSGEIINLTENTLLLSFTYPVGEGKIMQLDLFSTHNVTLH